MQLKNKAITYYYLVEVNIHEHQGPSSDMHIYEKTARTYDEGMPYEFTCIFTLSISKNISVSSSSMFMFNDITLAQNLPLTSLIIEYSDMMQCKSQTSKFHPSEHCAASFQCMAVGI